MKRHAALGAGMVLVAATGLAGAAQVAAAPSLPGSAVAPTLNARISPHSFKLTGDRSFTSNRVTVTLHAVKKERELMIAKFKPGYTLADLQGDIRYFEQHGGNQGQPTPQAIHRLDHAINHVGLFGGLDAEGGQTLTMTAVLPPGRYAFLDDSRSVPMRPRIVNVSGPTAVAAPGPVTTSTVTMKAHKRRFGGDTTLPASGSITIENHSAESPHLFVLLHVKNGTTRKQVRNGLTSNHPTFFRKGSAGTDALGKGKSQTLSYELPKGTYAELCFFPDPKTGAPHAFMGMIRMVHLT